MEPLLVIEIKKLTQQEGLTDAEVASLLGYSRQHIIRLRKKHGIPKRNIKKRKDKKMECSKCGKITYIRREERRRSFCEICRAK